MNYEDFAEYLTEWRVSNIGERAPKWPGNGTKHCAAIGLSVLLEALLFNFKKDGYGSLPTS